MADLREFFNPAPVPMTSELSAEINLVAPELRKFGILDPHAVVQEWLGKTDWDGHLMSTPQQVVNFFYMQVKRIPEHLLPGTLKAEDVEAHAQRTSAQAPAQAPQADAGDAEPVVKSSTPSKHGEALRAWKEQNNSLNAAWREAVRQRKEAIEQWDRYVETQRLAFQQHRNARPLR